MTFWHISSVRITKAKSDRKSQEEHRRLLELPLFPVPVEPLETRKKRSYSSSNSSVLSPSIQMSIQSKKSCHKIIVQVPFSSWSIGMPYEFWTCTKLSSKMNGHCLARGMFSKPQTRNAVNKSKQIKHFLFWHQDMLSCKVWQTSYTGQVWKHLQTTKIENVQQRIENIEGRGENADNHSFLLFPQCFQKASFRRSLMARVV